ncbi:MAG TPA: RNA-guided endonuclease IscB, partial [Bacteroidia bacterium]|nr:RNA-guided endonuclease IscB [Bacteroidia bacterium]
MKKRKMQKLGKRKTYTSTSASQARGNCDLQLNKEETLSVASLKTSLNAPEVNLRQRTDGRKVRVYVISIEGKKLMSCSAAKARKLVDSGKAKVFKSYPYTIQLNFTCENQVQKVKFGMDAGFNYVGFSAVSEKKELASGTLVLDNKTSERLTERKMYRNQKRSKLWYREPRFNNRGNKKQGWLPPSIQRKYDAHLKLLKIYQGVLPITEVEIEVANFDIQKILDAEINGIQYQQGDLYGFQNVRSYLFARENGVCQCCNKKIEKGQKAHIHHCDERGEGGSNRASNLALLHKKCHDKLHKKGLKLSAPKRLKAETFMSIIQHKFEQDIPNVKITFGYKTFVDRNKLGLEKTHYNDAFVI